MDMHPRKLDLTFTQQPDNSWSVRIDNAECVEEVLAIVQGRARTHLLTVEKIADTIAHAETRRMGAELTDEMFDGAELIVNPHMERETLKTCTFAVLRYRGWSAEKDARGWYLTYVGRTRMRQWAGVWYAYIHGRITLSVGHSVDIANTLLGKLHMQLSHCRAGIPRSCHETAKRHIVCQKDTRV